MKSYCAVRSVRGAGSGGVDQYDAHKRGQRTYMEPTHCMTVPRCALIEAARRQTREETGSLIEVHTFVNQLQKDLEGRQVKTPGGELGRQIETCKTYLYARGQKIYAAERSVEG